MSEIVRYGIETGIKLKEELVLEQEDFIVSPVCIVACPSMFHLTDHYMCAFQQFFLNLFSVNSNLHKKELPDQNVWFSYIPGT